MLQIIRNSDGKVLSQEEIEQTFGGLDNTPLYYIPAYGEWRIKNSEVDYELSDTVIDQKLFTISDTNSVPIESVKDAYEWAVSMLESAQDLANVEPPLGPVLRDSLSSAMKSAFTQLLPELAKENDNG